MPKNLNRLLPLAVLLSPLLLAVLATLFGMQVSGRDDINYLSELQTRPYLVPAPDQLSWIGLKVMTENIPDPVVALRLAGFLVCLGTCLAILSKRVGDWALACFALSIAPLYWTLYFNQIRLGIGIALYLLLLTRVRPLLAPVGAALAHSSVLIFIFPPAIIAAPFMLGVMELLDPGSFAAVRFAAYRDAEYLLMPWYFGWELVALALAFAVQKQGGRAVGLIVYAVAVRLLADRISVDIARRLLELGLFIYSPVIAYLRTRTLPAQHMVGLYVLFGLLSLYTALAGGVVRIGAG